MLRYALDALNLRSLDRLSWRFPPPAKRAPGAILGPSSHRCTGGNEKAPASRARWREVRSAKVPHALPLELSVLPDSGGQAFAGDPDNLSHWNSPSYRLKSRTNFAILFSIFGPRSTGAEADGAEGSRTPDLCSAIAALSQLSYSPESQTHAAPQSVRGRATYNGSFAPRCSQDEPSSMKVTVRRRGGEGRQFARRGGV